jgi:hypothetical protein
VGRKGFEPSTSEKCRELRVSGSIERLSAPIGYTV